MVYAKCELVHGREERAPTCSCASMQIRTHERATGHYTYTPHMMRGARGNQFVVWRELSSMTGAALMSDAGGGV